jgi:hypothetical protein
LTIAALCELIKIGRPHELISLQTTGVQQIGGHANEAVYATYSYR